MALKCCFQSNTEATLELIFVINNSVWLIIFHNVFIQQSDTVNRSGYYHTHFMGHTATEWQKWELRGSSWVLNLLFFLYHDEGLNSY